MKKLFKQAKKGFTIVELVIVIGVIGILSAILIPTFVNMTSKADQAALKSNLANSYALYAADAADGHVGDDGADLVFRGQEEVALSETLLTAGDNKSAFLYTAGEGWNVEKANNLTILDAYPTSAQTGKYYKVSDVKYGEYYVYYKLNATDYKPAA